MKFKFGNLKIIRQTAKLNMYLAKFPLIPYKHGKPLEIGFKPHM